MAKGRSSHDKKMQAQDLYINTDYNVEEIADFCGLAVSTIQRYIRENKWNELKAANNLTKPKILSNLYKRLLQLTEDDAIANAQKIAMLAGAIEKMDKRANASHYIQVFKQFNQYLISAGEVELAKAFNSHQRNFLDYLANTIRY